MVSDIEFLEAVCERMHQVGLVQSKADFSTRMLGKGASYLTSMSARDRKVPDEVMTFLIGQLKADMETGDVAIFILSEQCEQQRRDQRHRNDLLGWIARHRAPPIDSPVKASMEPGRAVIGPSIWRKLAGRLGRLGISSPLPLNDGRQG